MFTVGVCVLSQDDKIKWFGNLPLDFSYKSNSTRFYAPIGSMILLVVLSIVAKYFIDFLNNEKFANIITIHWADLGARQYKYS